MDAWRLRDNRFFEMFYSENYFFRIIFSKILGQKKPKMKFLYREEGLEKLKNENPGVEKERKSAENGPKTLF